MWTSTVKPFFPHQLSHWAVLLYAYIYIIIPLVSEIIENGSPDQEKKTHKYVYYFQLMKRVLTDLLNRNMQ